MSRRKPRVERPRSECWVCNGTGYVRAQATRKTLQCGECGGPLTVEAMFEGDPGGEPELADA